MTTTQAALLEALKPCPFCGNRPTLTVRPNNAEASEYFAAVSCFCGGYSACAHKMATAPEAADAEAMARAAWNGRAALRAADAAQPEPVLWQFRHRGQQEWEEVKPWNPRMQTLEQRIRELRGFSYKGEKVYEVRPLYAAPPQPAPIAAQADLERECAAVDELLRRLGLDPERCRTEGGAINMPRVRSLLQDAAQAGPMNHREAACILAINSAVRRLRDGRAADALAPLMAAAELFKDGATIAAQAAPSTSLRVMAAAVLRQLQEPFPRDEIDLDAVRALALAAQAGPALVPLTDEQIDALALDESGLPNSHLEFARAIERAHGIGAQAPASTRPADASISGQRGDVVPPSVVAALRFYAQRQHFAISDRDAWDTVSGEPPNYWCDDAGTATVEDGAIARIALEALAAAPQAPAERPADVFSLMLHSKPRHEDAPGTVLLDEHFRVAPAEPAAQAVEQDATRDTRKLCTCDGAGRGPGRACVVKAGGRLGELWRCAEGATPAAREAGTTAEG